jgi:hypothetical protein
MILETKEKSQGEILYSNSESAVVSLWKQTELYEQLRVTRRRGRYIEFIHNLEPWFIHDQSLNRDRVKDTVNGLGTDGHAVIIEMLLATVKRKW